MRICESCQELERCLRELRADLATVRTDRNFIKGGLDGATIQLRNTRQERDEMRRDLESVTATLEQVRRTCDALTENARVFVTAHNKLLEERDNLKMRLEGLLAERGEARKELASVMQTECDKLREEHDEALREDRDKAEAERDAARAERDEARAECNKAQVERDEAKSKLADLGDVANTNTALKSECGELRKERDEAQEDLDKSRSANRLIRDECNDAISDRRNTEAITERLKREREKTISERDDLRRAVAELHRERDKAEAERNAVRKELNEIKDRHAVTMGYLLEAYSERDNAVSMLALAQEERLEARSHDDDVLREKAWDLYAKTLISMTDKGIVDAVDEERLAEHSWRRAGVFLAAEVQK